MQWNPASPKNTRQTGLFVRCSCECTHAHTQACTHAHTHRIAHSCPLHFMSGCHWLILHFISSYQPSACPFSPPSTLCSKPLCLSQCVPKWAIGKEKYTHGTHARTHTHTHTHKHTTPPLPVVWPVTNPLDIMWVPWAGRLSMIKGVYPIPSCRGPQRL